MCRREAEGLLSWRRSVLVALFALLAALVATTVSADSGPITLGFVHRDSAHSTEAMNTYAYGEDVYLTGSSLPTGTDYYRVVDLQTNLQLAWGEIKPTSKGDLDPTLIWRSPDVAGDTFQVQIGRTPFPSVGQHDSGLNGGYNYDAPSASVAPIPIAAIDFYITPPGLDVPEVPTPAVYLLGLGLVGGFVWWRRRHHLVASGT